MKRNLPLMKTIIMVMLGALCALQLLALWRAPTVYSPAQISVSLAPGQNVTLGQRELAAPQAQPTQLSLRRDDAGAWWLRNLGAARPVLLTREASERRTGSSVLLAGQQVRIGAARYSVVPGDPGAISFTRGAEHWRYDGATLYRNGAAQAPCSDASLTARLLGVWNRVMPHALDVARSLSFGGNLHCGNRIGIEWVGNGSATLARIGADFILTPARGVGRAPILVSDARGSIDPARAEQALAGVTALVAGRTRYSVDPVGAGSATLTLRPQRRVALFTEAQVQLPDHVSWGWQRRAHWALPVSPLLYGGALLAALAGAACMLRGAAPVRSALACSATVAIAGVTFMLMQRSGAGPGPGVSLLLGWAALWCCLLAPGRLTLVTGAGLLLLAIGLLAQLDLGLGALESSWLRHFHKSVALLAVGLGAGTHLRLQLRGRTIHAPQSRLEWTLAVLAALALAALLMQVLFGDETGVFDIQPVEFAKLVLTALTAHCIAIGLGWHAGMPEQHSRARRWMRLAAPALLFVALLGLALVQVDDFSPLILLLVWSTVMALAWSVAARNMVSMGALLTMVLLVAVSIATLRSAGAQEAAQWGFYADRFMVWLDPASHPHTGQQLLLAAHAIAQGAWFGADHALGIVSLGQSAGSALHIPAVQDDFAPSFFVNRHGLAGALALWTLQAMFVAGLLHTAASVYAAGERSRDFRQAQNGRFGCFVLCGGAAFVLGHLLLSWGTNLAIFPIMGQPMSFLSAGGSHLLLFICPLLAFSAISAQSLEEKHHAGLRPT